MLFVNRGGWRGFGAYSLPGIIAACELPDYQSKNGQIVAVSANGTEVPLQIKGVNWFGMETKLASPFGLWENALNGTTAVRTAALIFS